MGDGEGSIPSRGTKRSVARPVRVVEARTGKSWTGDLRAVRAAAGRVDSVEPLREERVQASTARSALIRHPCVERSLQLSLSDARAAEVVLDLLHRAGEVRLAEDLAQRYVRRAGPRVGRAPREQPGGRRVRRRGGPEAAGVRVVPVELIDQALLECGIAGRRARAAGSRLRVAG